MPEQLWEVRSGVHEHRWAKNTHKGDDWVDRFTLPVSSDFVSICCTSVWGMYNCKISKEGERSHTAVQSVLAHVALCAINFMDDCYFSKLTLQFTSKVTHANIVLFAFCSWWVRMWLSPRLHDWPCQPTTMPRYWWVHAEARQLLTCLPQLARKLPMLLSE